MSSVLPFLRHPLLRDPLLPVLGLPLLFSLQACGDGDDDGSWAPGDGDGAGGLVVSGAGGNTSTLGSGGGNSSGAGGAQTSSGGATTGNGAGGGPSEGAGGMSAGSGGTGSDSGSGGAPQQGGIFSECRFHFGTFRDFAVDHPAIREQIDYFVPGWMGLSNTFDQQYVCDDVSGVLEGKVPVVVAYVSAFYAKREQGLHDCNAGTPNLCAYGSEIIKNNVETIVGIYRNYAQGYASCLGDSPIIFEMEPDWYQYTYPEQTSPMTAAESAQIIEKYVKAIREYLPNARFSMDVSPWVAPDNGSDQGADWFSHFDMSLFTFVNTSGGGTEAGNSKIRSSNNMTWAGVQKVTSKPVLADTGYGVNGASAGHDAAWDNVGNINARIADGVLGIAQYNPNSNWGETIASIRGQLDKPASCP